MNEKEFGLFMTKLRESAGYESQASLAKVSGVWNSTIARIEAGATKNPDPATLIKLAPFLKVSQDELMIAAGYITASNSNEIPSVHEPPDIFSYNEDELKIVEELHQMLDGLTPEERKKRIEKIQLALKLIE